MVRRAISKDIKECALRLWEQGWHPDDLCDLLAVSPASLYRWRATLQQLGDVNRPVTRQLGRPRLMTTAITSGLHLLLATEPALYLDELVWWLGVQHDIVISKSALAVNLKALGLTRKVLHSPDCSLSFCHARRGPISIATSSESS